MKKPPKSLFPKPTVFLLPEHEAAFMKAWNQQADGGEAGTILGDDPELMRLKAGRLVRLLRSMAGTSRYISQLTLPVDLSPAQVETIEASFREAIKVAVEQAGDRHLNLVMEAGYELCSSLLATRKE